MNEFRTAIIKAAIENHIGIEETKRYLELLERTDYSKTMEIRIGVLAEATGNYKTVCQRCNEMGIESIGDLVRLGGKAFRESPNVGVKTATLVSDVLADKFGIYNWYSKDKE